MSRLPLGTYLGSIFLLIAAVGLGVGLFWGIGRLEPESDSKPKHIEWKMWLSGDPESADSIGQTDGQTKETVLLRETELPLVQGRSPFVAVAEKVLPAVVNIVSERIFRHEDVEGMAGDALRRLFPELEEEIEIPSTGSGFLITPEGYIVTNFHVVYNAEQIYTTMADGERYDAELVGADPPSDIAVLKITAPTDLPYVEIGNSEDLKIGDWVAAIGNPFGNLEGTLTVGVVSAKGRNELAIAGGSPIYQDFIQTDASINFGNSGGPLVNTNGEAVGINTAFNAPGQGISFAISMRMAGRIIDDLITNGRVIRGFLGVTLQALDPRLAEAWDLEDRSGVIISDVIPDTPASDAGFLAGDLLLEFDGRTVIDIQPFRLLVAETPVGKEVEVRYWREGEIRNTQVVLAERPGMIASLEPPEEQQPEESGTLGSTGEILWDHLGLSVQAMLEGVGGEPSLQVTRVRVGGPSFRSGIREGDFVVESDGLVLEGRMNDLLHSVEEAIQHKKAMILRIFRGGAYSYVAITPDQS